MSLPEELPELPRAPIVVVRHTTFGSPGRFSYVAEGTVRHSGLGNVRVWPGDEGQTEFVWFESSSPNGHALFIVPLNVVMPWLARTYHLVPAGAEAAALGLDTELAWLLGEAA